jgi:hypothetical protein
MSETARKILLGTLVFGAGLCAPAFADDEVLANCQAEHAGKSDATTVAEYCVKMSRLADKQQAARTLGYTDGRCVDAGGRPPPPGYRGRWLSGYCTYRNPETGAHITVYGY